MKPFFKKISVILIISVLLTGIVSFISLKALHKSSFYKPSFLVNKVKQKQFDYIVLGASTGLTTLNTATIDSISGTNGVNLSMDDTALSSQYLMLQHFLAEGKTTKFCVLAPSAPSFNIEKQKLSDNDYRFLPFIDRDYVSKYYQEFSDDQAHILSASRWFPTVGMSYYNAELFYPGLLSLVKPDKRNRFDTKGNYTYPNRNRLSEQITSFKNVKIEFKNSYVNKIKALCEANNIQLLIYFSPMEGRKVITNTTEYSIINHSDLLTNTMYFYDTIHVNTKGRKEASERFADELYDLIH